MKTFIVCLALLMVNVACVTYAGDMSRYTRLQAFPKAAAEECVSGAALSRDGQLYADGLFAFDRDGAREYAENYLDHALCRSGFKVKTCTISLEFEDDIEGYGEENAEERPAVTCGIKAETEDLFRLPFLSVTSVERKAKYEVVF